MRTPLSEKMGIDVPIFAFSHSREVVVAVTRAGGFGVLGAAYFTQNELANELDWIDAQIGGGAYGVDIMLPQRELSKTQDPVALRKELSEKIPEGHTRFAEELLQLHDVPRWPEAEEDVRLLGWTSATVMPLLEESLKHPKCTLIANALGVPPRHVVERIQKSGRLVAGLCGRVQHAQKNQRAGVDVIIAVGGEGGGHVGEIGSVVLWPQVIDAVSPTPVLAAGGVGNGAQIAAAIACGAQGVWMGTVWLTVEESAVQSAQRQSYIDAASEDTVRSRSWTGKPSRVLRNAWTQAWDRDDAPTPLEMPLQGLVSADAMRRTERYGDVGSSQAVACSPAGQVVGQTNEVQSCAAVIDRLKDEYAAAIARLNRTQP